MQYGEIIEMLRNNVCEATFTKVNGDKRVMPCTLRADILKDAPYAQDGEKVEERSANHTVVRCLATDINQWRSFKVDNLVEIKKVL